MFTSKEKETLRDLVITEAQTTMSNHSDKKWINAYIDKQNKLIEKIEKHP